MNQKKKTEKSMPGCRIRSLFYHDISCAFAAEYIHSVALENRFLAVFTPGATVAARAERKETERRLLTMGDLLLPDGVGCRLAAALSGKRLHNVTPGIEVGEALLKLADESGMRVFLYGGKEGVARAAAEALEKKYRQITFAFANGYGASPDDEIRRFRPHILFVCLGFPKQESWIASRKDVFSFPCLALGGSLDVFAGRLRRAPLLFRRAGLEWLWRSLCEPRRFGRLLPLPRYFFGCMREGIGRFLQKIQKRDGKSI